MLLLDVVHRDRLCCVCISRLDLSAIYGLATSGWSIPPGCRYPSSQKQLWFFLICHLITQVPNKKKRKEKKNRATLDQILWKLLAVISNPGPEKGLLILTFIGRAPPVSCPGVTCGCGSGNIDKLAGRSSGMKPLSIRVFPLFFFGE